MKIRWEQVESGETIRVPIKKWVIACCDCGLVHTLEFKGVDKKGKKLLVKATRKNRLTGQRRAMKTFPMVPK